MTAPGPTGPTGPTGPAVEQHKAVVRRLAARFRCSGTHTGTWRGHSPTGRRFTGVDEVYFFRFTDGLISAAWGLEDTRRRLSQLGLPG